LSNSRLVLRKKSKMPAWLALPSVVDTKGSKASRSLDACLPPVRKSEPGVKVDKRQWAAFEDVTEREGFIRECILFRI
jgi:hypothetical protein